MAKKDSSRYDETPKFLVQPETNIYQERHKDSEGRWYTSNTKKTEINIWGNLIEFVKFREYGETHNLLTPEGIESMNLRLAKALDLHPTHVRKAFDNYPKELMAHYIKACPDDHPADKIVEFSTYNARKWSLAAGMGAAPAALTSIWYAVANGTPTVHGDTHPLFGYIFLGVALAATSLIGFISLSEEHEKISEAGAPGSNDVVEFRDALRRFIVDKNHALGIDEIASYEDYVAREASLAPATVQELTPDQLDYLEAYREQMGVLNKSLGAAPPTAAELARLNATLDFKRAHENDVHEHPDAAAAAETGPLLLPPPEKKRVPLEWPKP